MVKQTNFHGVILKGPKFFLNSWSCQWPRTFSDVGIVNPFQLRRTFAVSFPIDHDPGLAVKIDGGTDKR